MNAKLPELKKKVGELRKTIVEMVEARFPKQEEESNYIGMRKVREGERDERRLEEVVAAVGG